MLSPRRHDRVKRIENWIDEHLQEQIDLDRLAGVGGVKAHALAKATSAARGLSPMGLVLSRRLEMSRRLLLAGKGKTVSEIAHYCGFKPLGTICEYRSAFGEYHYYFIAAAQLIVRFAVPSPGTRPTISYAGLLIVGRRKAQ